MRGARIGARTAIAALSLLLAACTTSALPATPLQPSPRATTTGQASATPASSQSTSAGGLDKTFGKGGLAATDMGGTDDSAHAVVVMPDGEIIVAGEARPDANSLVSFALAGYSADGRPDPRFGQLGTVFTSFGEFNGSGVLAAALQPDNKIVVVGYAANPDAHHDTFALARYDAFGFLDGGFGRSGHILTAIDQQTGAGPEDRANAVAIDAQGRILVAGETGSFLHDFALARYLPNGSLDRTFGDGGIVVTDLGGDDRAQSVVALADGAILVGGSGWVSSGAEDFALVRYLDDGGVDPSFGIGGKVVTDFRGGDDRGMKVLVRPDGRFLLAGTIQLSGGCSPNPCERYGFGLAVYTASGALDSAFGVNGKVEMDFIASSGAYAAVLMPNGVVGLAGHIGNEDFGLAFVDDNGKSILVENGSEAAQIDFAGQSDRAFAAALGPNGTVLLAGDATLTDGGFDFGLARYIAPSG